jgi:hypothetical protein
MTVDLASASVWTLYLQKRKKRGIGSNAVELLQDSKTKEIRGMIAHRQGNKIYVKAKKVVVLYTGGFENNQDMIRDHLRLPCGYHKATTGQSCG